jgi:hypothetical protein
VLNFANFILQSFDIDASFWDLRQVVEREILPVGWTWIYRIVRKYLYFRAFLLHLDRAARGDRLDSASEVEPGFHSGLVVGQSHGWSAHLAS